MNTALSDLKHTIRVVWLVLYQIGSRSLSLSLGNMKSSLSQSQSLSLWTPEATR